MEFVGVNKSFVAYPSQAEFVKEQFVLAVLPEADYVSYSKLILLIGEFLMVLFRLRNMERS